jgi:hypothetical protein
MGLSRKPKVITGIAFHFEIFIGTEGIAGCDPKVITGIVFTSRATR